MCRCGRGVGHRARDRVGSVGHCDDPTVLGGTARVARWEPHLCRPRVEHRPPTVEQQHVPRSQRNSTHPVVERARCARATGPVVEHRLHTAGSWGVHGHLEHVGLGRGARRCLDWGLTPIEKLGVAGLRGPHGDHDAPIRPRNAPTEPLREGSGNVIEMTPNDVADALSRHGYLPDEGMSTAVFLAMTLQRPLLLEGEAGVGKTEVAKTLAAATGGQLIRLQCYEGIDVSQAVYDWDYARQLLHLRATEATGESSSAPPTSSRTELYDERFLIKRALLRAIEPVGGPAAGAADRRDRPSRRRVRGLPARGAVRLPDHDPRDRRVQRRQPPLVVLTSNRTRDVHDALKRRCLYHWVEHPDFEREVAIVKLRVPAIEARASPARSPPPSRPSADCRSYKPPGVAETIDWATALGRLGATSSTSRSSPTRSERCSSTGRTTNASSSTASRPGRGGDRDRPGAIVEAPRQLTIADT